MSSAEEVDVLKLYLNDLKQYKTKFSKDQNIELIIKAQNGDAESWEKVLCHNARLVVKLAARFSGKGVPIEDLISEGNIGLAYAIKKYDPSRGTSLSTVAYFWIAQAMGRAIEKYSTIKIPVAEIRILKAVTRKIEEEGLSVEKAISWAAKTYNKDRKDILELLVMGRTCSSLDSPISENPSQEQDADTFLDLVPDGGPGIDVAVQIIRLKADIEAETKRLLSERENFVIRERFGLDNSTPPKTLDEVARLLGVSKERVRTIQLSALEKLRKSKILRDYTTLSQNLAY